MPISGITFHFTSCEVQDLVGCNSISNPPKNPNYLEDVFFDTSHDLQMRNMIVS